MTSATDTFEFLNELEQNENELPNELVQALKNFKADFQEHNGLIPNASVPALLNVSRQRWDQLREKYGFWSAEYFDKTWFSRQQLEDFYKVQRKTGAPAHNVAKVLKTLLPTSE